MRAFFGKKIRVLISVLARQSGGLSLFRCRCAVFPTTEQKFYCCHRSSTRMPNLPLGFPATLMTLQDTGNGFVAAALGRCGGQISHLVPMYNKCGSVQLLYGLIVLGH